MPRFFKLQLFWLAISVITPAGCMVLRLADAVDPLLLSNIALPSLLTCWVLALLSPVLFARGADRESRMTGFVVAWSAIAVFFPLCWDLPWAVLHEWISGATAGDAAEWYFWAYAVADTRFLRGDHLMVIVEYWSGVIGVVEIVFVVLLRRNQLSKATRVFVSASSLQFYGCTVFFLSEAVSGFPSIRPDLVSYVKFFGLNGMWVVVPALAGLVLLQLTRNPAYDARTAIGRLFSGAHAVSPAAHHRTRTDGGVASSGF